MGQEAGRPRQADVTTMNLVLKACPEIGNSYGVILPKINKKMTNKLIDKKSWAMFLGGLFKGKFLSLLFSPLNSFRGNF